MTVTNNFNCSTNDTLDVTVIPPGIPNAGPDLLICLGDSVMLNGTQQMQEDYLDHIRQWNIFSIQRNSYMPYYVPAQDTSAGFAQIVLTTTGACLNLTDTLLLNIEGFAISLRRERYSRNSGPNTGVNLPLTPLVVNSPTIIWTSTGTGTFSPSDTSANATYTPEWSGFRSGLSDSYNYSYRWMYYVDGSTQDWIHTFVIPNVFTPIRTLRLQWLFWNKKIFR